MPLFLGRNASIFGTRCLYFSGRDASIFWDVMPNFEVVMTQRIDDQH
ncbi:uncharacterized protein G2W53_041136 [Senna tora]|uniref:Uncharacterized protein n=1 Tax=Senna tora TaxID=362788 RepID=A0A834VYY4_9FABA|nr:uncharacterized protein G2W53_041136 [Senna tora]